MTNKAKDSLDIKTYTMVDLVRAWDEYKSRVAWSMKMTNGKSKLVFKAPDFAAEQPVRCDMVRIEAVMSFPRYLEVFDA